MQRNHIRTANQLIERIHLFIAVMAGDVLIVKDNLAAETAQEAGHQLSDMPQPDQTHHFAAQFRNGPVVWTLFAPELIAQRIV
ncbi:Uncharacterised protein [Klebsiella pneumoniae]|nr:Uncharacterised protein [Klebsiella pneumoniae]